MAEEPLLDRDFTLKEREVVVKEREIGLKEKEAKRWRLFNPLVLAVSAAALSLFGNIFVTRSNNQNTQTIERFRAQSTLILQAIRTNGDTKEACKNLIFFVGLGLIDDSNKAIAQACAGNREGAPSLPSASSIQYLPPRDFSKDFELTPVPQPKTHP